MNNGEERWRPWLVQKEDGDIEKDDKGLGVKMN